MCQSKTSLFTLFEKKEKRGELERKLSAKNISGDSLSHEVASDYF